MFVCQGCWQLRPTSLLYVEQQSVRALLKTAGEDDLGTQVKKQKNFSSLDKVPHKLVRSSDLLQDFDECESEVISREGKREKCY